MSCSTLSQDRAGRFADFGLKAKGTVAGGINHSLALQLVDFLPVQVDTAADRTGEGGAGVQAALDQFIDGHVTDAACRALGALGPYQGSPT